MTARLAHIWRHPVKSLGRHAVERVKLEPGKPMPCDRCWAIAHEASKFDGDWVPCQNFSRGSQSPGLMAVDTEWDQASGNLTFRHPDLPDLIANPDTDSEKVIGWLRPLVPDNRPAPVRIITLPERGLTDTDYASVSIGSLSSLKALGQRVGSELDMRRMRINFWLDGLAAWQEAEWVGKRLRLGGAVLEVKEQITRCKATEANPTTGTRDAGVLSALNEMGHQEFGIYAVVVEGGEVLLGDRLEVLS